MPPVTGAYSSVSASTTGVETTTKKWPGRNTRRTRHQPPPGSVQDRAHFPSLPKTSASEKLNVSFDPLWSKVLADLPTASAWVLAYL